MHDEQQTVWAPRRLPPEALAGLRQAYSRELAERVPRLRMAVASGQEALLVQRPVGAAACADLRRAVDSLGEHLAGWRP